jgi:DNA-directed RNA polymerase subunit N (RpoN/RPB10)
MFMDSSELDELRPMLTDLQAERANKKMQSAIDQYWEEFKALLEAEEWHKFEYNDLGMYETEEDRLLLSNVELKHYDFYSGALSGPMQVNAPGSLELF